MIFKNKNLIKPVRDEIFRLAKQAKDLETMHWYIALDDCFKNDEFSSNNFDNLVWRLNYLDRINQPITKLINLIDPIIRESGILNFTSNNYGYFCDIKKEQPC